MQENNNNAPKRSKLSGAYWYSDKDEEFLTKRAFDKTLLAVIALLLQIVVLLFPQGGLEYVTKNIASYAYAYMWAVFVMLGVSVFVVIMDMKRYKPAKRIPKERAPKNGFKYRAFFGEELFVVVHAIIFIMELSFVIISFDGWGLAAVFVCAAAVAAAVMERQMTVMTLKDAELIPALQDPPTDEETDSSQESEAAPESEESATDGEEQQ